MKLQSKKGFVFIKDGQRAQAKIGDLIEVKNKNEALQLINAEFAIAYVEPKFEQKTTKKGSKYEEIGQ